MNTLCPGAHDSLLNAAGTLVHSYRTEKLTIPLQNPASAAEYFARKTAFTTGPVEVSHFMKAGDQMGLIDVREEEDYAKGHLPGATNLPESQWSTSEGLRRDVMNIFYCYGPTCHLAARAARHFATQGYQVMEMEGGYEAWKEKNLKIEKGYRCRGAIKTGRVCAIKSGIVACPPC